MMGKTLSSVLSKPFVPVNHLEGHALIAKMTNNVEYPYLLMLVSGGHCQFVAVLGLGKYVILGETLDDAVGEAFDKVAKMLGLDFPGGPIIEKMALNGNKNSFKFPRPLINQKDCKLSFSGLKTAVRNAIATLDKPFSTSDICNISASFQQAVSDVLARKTLYALEIYETFLLSNNLPHNRVMVISGGVASNSYIRQELKAVLDVADYDFVAPPAQLCTDNAVMIAFAGLERLKSGTINYASFEPRARWSLEDLS
jgi:N6-L-threonylcarbamoyladenine synthase